VSCHRVMDVVALGSAALIVAALAIGAHASPAAAASIIDAGQPGLLWLEVAPGPMDVTLTPGDRAWWAVTARLDAPEDSPLEVVIERSGVLAMDPEGLRLEVLECAEAWVTPADPLGTAVCGTGASVLIADRPLAQFLAGERFDLGPLLAGGARHLLLIVGLPSSTPSSLQGQHGDLAVGFFVEGDGERTEGPRTAAPPLPATGAPALVAVPLALAAVLMVIGAAMRARRDRRSRHA